MLAAVATLVLALLLLAGGAEGLVRGAVTLARRWRVSSLFIGLTIVGFGTSAPEFASSALAGLRGQTGIAVGNVLGSNLFNIAFILGLTAVIRPVVVRLEQVRVEVFVTIAVAVIPFIALGTDYRFDRWFGGLLLVGLGAYVAWGFRRARTHPEPEAPEAETELERELALQRPAMLATPMGAALLALAGLAVLLLGAHLLVESASDLARRWGLSELIIGMTIVAAGTSAPELVTAIVATRRGQPDLVVGNILGSNIFNVLGVLGATAALRPQVVQPAALWVDAPVMLLASIALLPIVTTAQRVSRAEGGFLLLGYALFLVCRITIAPTWFGAAG